MQHCMVPLHCATPLCHMKYVHMVLFLLTLQYHIYKPKSSSTSNYMLFTVVVLLVNLFLSLSIVEAVSIQHVLTTWYERKYSYSFIHPFIHSYISPFNFHHKKLWLL